MLGDNHLEREESEYGNSNDDRTVLISIHMKIMMEIITLILGKVDQVTVPNAATTLRVRTLVLSLIGYQAN